MPARHSSCRSTATCASRAAGTPNSFACGAWRQRRAPNPSSLHVRAVRRVASQGGRMSALARTRENSHRPARQTRSDTSCPTTYRTMCGPMCSARGSLAATAGCGLWVRRACQNRHGQHQLAFAQGGRFESARMSRFAPPSGRPDSRSPAAGCGRRASTRASLASPITQPAGGDDRSGRGGGALRSVAQGRLLRRGGDNGRCVRSTNRAVVSVC
jgi:hypothetical protein